MALGLLASPHPSPLCSSSSQGTISFWKTFKNIKHKVAFVTSVICFEITRHVLCGEDKEQDVLLRLGVGYVGFDPCVCLTFFLSKLDASFDCTSPIITHASLLRVQIIHTHQITILALSSVFMPRVF